MREMKDSGITYIGSIPSEWEIIPIKARYRFSTGFTPPSGQDEYYDPDGETWITIADMKDDITVNSEKHITKSYAEQKGKKVPKGSLLYSFKLSVGKTTMLGCSAYTNEAIAAFPSDENPCTEYLRYSSMFIEGNANENIYGAKILNQQLINNAPVPYPPMSEQYAIVKFLDPKCAAIGEAIERHKKAIEKLEEYKRASIISMVSGRSLNCDMKDSGIEWMTKVPIKWDVVPLRLVFEERKHKNVGMECQNLLTLSYGKLKRKDIYTNEGLLPASFEGYNIIEPGDIVMRLIDLQNDKHSLRTGLATERGIITSAYVTLKPIKAVNSRYFRYLLHSYDLQKVLYTMGEGVRQSLNYDDIGRGLLLVVPDMTTQNNIADAIEQMEQHVDSMIIRQEQVIEKLEEYRKSLIYHAVTGKIDCRGVNAT